MRKTQSEILEYQEFQEEIKKSAVLSEEEKAALLKALSDSFNKDIEPLLDSPERETIDALIDKFTGGE